MFIVRISTAAIITLISFLYWTSSVDASLYQSNDYNLEEDGVEFVGRHSVSYSGHSDHFDINYSDLYINITSSGDLVCSFSKISGNPPGVTGAYREDDNAPSTFTSSNTPNWMEVDWNESLYWGNSVISINHRATTVPGYCAPGWYSEFAGIIIYYSPSTGFLENDYSS